MTLSDSVKHPAVKWSALVALLVGLTQFDKGLEVFYSKWNANLSAAEAKQIAVEAKQEASGVNDRFDRYITEQRQATKEEELRNKLQAEYNQQLLAIQQSAAQQQVPNQAAPTTNELLSGPSVWLEPQTVKGRWVCTDLTGQRWWWDSERGCD